MLVAAVLIGVVAPNAPRAVEAAKVQAPPRVQVAAAACSACATAEDGLQLKLSTMLGSAGGL